LFFVKLDKEKLLAKDPGALSDLERVCRECARIGASRVGALDFVDDIVQEVMLKLLTEWIHAYDPSRDVEPTLIEASKYVGQTLRRKYGREVTMGDAGDEGHSDTWINTVADPNYEDLGDLVDRENEETQAEAAAMLASASMEFAKAIASAEAESTSQFSADSVGCQPAPEPNKPSRERIASHGGAETKGGRAPSRLQETPSSDPTWDEIVTGEFSKKPRKSGRELSRDAIRLREIRLAVRYTHEQMANHLQISLSQLHAIEYGVTQTPDGIVRKAELLLKMIEETAPALMQEDFSKIVSNWILRLGLAEGDYGGFTRVINELFGKSPEPRKINRSTVFRWLRGTYKPSPDLLWKIEALVQMVETQRQQLLKHLPRIA
jgi:DNA-directed RNA polymerase specialized sigma24 family protein/transcriptional regulator with XRE-family HTH domain